MKNVLIAIAASAFALSIAPAYATSSTEQVSICGDALEAVAPADQFKAKFLGIKGAALKTVTFKLTPVDGGDAQVAECKIKGETVVEAGIQGGETLTASRP